jgi:hypothetical protein
VQTIAISKSMLAKHPTRPNFRRDGLRIGFFRVAPKKTVPGCPPG